MPQLAETIHTIPIPSGVTIKVAEGNSTTVKGPKGTLQRQFRSLAVKVRVDGSNVVVSKELPRRKEKATAGTYASHIQNMIVGVTEGWTYSMKAVFNHFPIKMTLHGDEFHVENFLGERAPRVARIEPGVKITVKGADVTLEGVDLQAVSQSAANIENCTKIRNKDIRVFQDGVYITKKGE
ncbi:MAG: large subunit ribosomal protein [Thermoplasmata archaeon]|jgi:large subunit ribosomal protein L6|nr:large subunit ribosomal protein [Thermoplasmata archaeon]